MLFALSSFFVRVPRKMYCVIHGAASVLILSIVCGRLNTNQQVSLTIWDQDTDSVFELALKTQQASDMASIILDHINAIMANAGRN